MSSSRDLLAERREQRRGALTEVLKELEQGEITEERASVARRGKLLQRGRETERKQRKKRGISTKVSYLSLLILCNLFASVYC